MGILYLLLLLILFLLLITIIFYNNVRIRKYFFTNASEGDALHFNGVGDNYYSVSYDNNNTPIEFIPLYEDRKSKINGGLVLLTKGTVEEFYQVKVMDGTDVLSTSLQKVRPGPSYMRMTFTSGSGDNRKLRIQVRKYDTKLQNFIAGEPSFKLISAWAYYC